MAFCSPRRPSFLPPPFLLSSALLWIFVLAASLPAQDSPSADVPMTTLHAYADLIQIPVLVLDHDRNFTPKVDPTRFSIRLDSGHPFLPTYIRPEGDDPIALSILLDVYDLDRTALPRIDKAIANLAPLSLHPRDRVSIYTLDCSLNHVNGLYPPSTVLLSRSVDAVLYSWKQRVQQKKSSACPRTFGLWDALFYLVDQLKGVPGRRVILALSSGIDHGSRLTWNQTKSYAQSEGVSVFGVRYVGTDSFGHEAEFHSSSGEIDIFSSVCELSGGIVVASNDDDMPGTLKRILHMIRDRYIVEFPRPRSVTTGVHDILVSIAKSNAIIRPGGISFPLPDASIVTNPGTLPSNPKTTPELGTRRILRPSPPEDEP